MSTRSRHEAGWTHTESTVKGRKNRNGSWVLIVLAAALVTVATVAYVQFMGFQTVTYELRHCAEPLTEDASWEQVQAAACDPAPASGTTVQLMHESANVEPDSTGDSSYVFEEWPVNSPAHAISMVLPEPARSVVVVEPEGQRIRDALTTDATSTRWGGFIGSRGPTTYWILVTP